MTASNHFIAGATIGAALGNPWLGVPLAIASHFVLDAGPHYGYEGPREKKRARFSLFQWVLALDMAMFLILIWTLTFVIDKPELILYGIAGYSPDLMWIHRFVVAEKMGSRAADHAMSRLQRFHAGIQRLERPWGLVVEIPFFIGVSYLLVRITA